MSHSTPMPEVAHRTLAAFTRVLATTPDAPPLLADDGAYTYAEAQTGRCGSRAGCGRSASARATGWC